MLKWIKDHLPKWLDLSHSKPWEKEKDTHTWEDTAPSEYEPDE
jgi:hypothetical protein|tara:strand:- start:319 stop:447 length:129 start_codon:yes stop_codon:yes gene_type:complete